MVISANISKIEWFICSSLKFVKMLTLKALPDTNFTECVVQLLRRHGIETVHYFINCEEEKLRKITNLSLASLAQIKRKLLLQHGPKTQRMSDMYADIVKANETPYKTGIKSLDALFQPQLLRFDCLTEICGFSGVGKTQLCLTLALNFASNYKKDVLYIDTKADCIGTRLYQMLMGRGLTKTQMGDIMQRIKLERVAQPSELLQMLEELQRQLEQGTNDVCAIKLVIIDSLPALWSHLLIDENQKLKAKYRLTRVANLMRQISAQHLVIFLYVNLLVKYEKRAKHSANLEVCAAEEVTELTSDEEAQTISQPFAWNPDAMSMEYLEKPALGSYWASVPSLRLSLEKLTEQSAAQQQDSSSGNSWRTLRVLQSCHMASGATCILEINDQGVL